MPRFQYLDPKIIMGFVVALIMIALGTFMIYTIWNTANDNIELTDTSTSTTTYSETFETDTNNSNPSESWYTYTEIGFNWSNVTSLEAHGGSNSYRINDTLGLDKSVYFNWTADDTEYFQFWFKVNGRMPVESRNYILDGAGNAVIRMDIFNNYVYFRNGTTVLWNGTVNTDNWYKIRLDFSFDNNTIRGRFSNETTTFNDSWCSVTDGIGTIIDYENTSSFWISGYAGKGIRLYLDDITLYDTDTTVTDAELPDIPSKANTVFNILGILLIIIALLTLASYVAKQGGIQF